MTSDAQGRTFLLIMPRTSDLRLMNRKTSTGPSKWQLLTKKELGGVFRLSYRTDDGEFCISYDIA